MKTPTVLLLLFLQTTVLSACHITNRNRDGDDEGRVSNNSTRDDDDDGRLQTETRHVSGFSGIKVSTGITVYLTMGNTEGAEVSASEKNMRYVRTEVEDGILHIYYKHNEGVFNWNSGHRTIKVKVLARRIESVAATSGSDVLGQNLINSDRLKIQSSSGATLKLDIATNDLDMSASSGADAELKGKATNVNGSASSGAGIKAGDLLTQSSKLEVSSGANISVSISKSLDGHASSGGSISYRGNPQNVTKDKSSGGSIESI